MAKPIALTVLAHDGVMARSYLALLRDSGFVPERIILLVGSDNAAYPARLLPTSWRTWYARRAQAAAAMYWVRRLMHEQKELFAVMASSISRAFGLAPGFHTALHENFDYRDFSDRLITVPVAGLKDPGLKVAVDQLPPGPILFTGGGIVPASLLGDIARPLLHVHPGRLPEVRGADGLLWSTALFGAPAASCFVMAPGLDTGRLLAVRQFPALQFELPRSTARPDGNTLYRMLYAYYDPILRARVFADIVRQQPEGDLSAMIGDAVPQDLAQGFTYNFMHAQLRDHVLARIFPKAPT